MNQIIKKIIAICLVIMVLVCAYTCMHCYIIKQCADNPYQSYARKEKRQIVENFEYIYKTSAEGAWITRIIPLDGKDISVLKIPSKLAGKRVVRLGSAGGRFREDDDLGAEWYDEIWNNLFGVNCSEDSTAKNIIIVPEDMYNKLEQIKEIYIPDTVSWIGLDLFLYVQNGKVLRLPAGLKTRLEDAGLTSVKWKEVSFSGENKNYKIINGYLCSKDGKTVYGLLEETEKASIPEGVKIISRKGDYFGTKEMYIPASVTEIEPPFTLGDFTTARVQIAWENRKYAEKNGSIYDKTSGELVAAYIDRGVINVPDTVRSIDHPWYIGDTTEFKKMIIPKSVKFMHTQSGEDVCKDVIGYSGVTYVFESKTPMHMVERSYMFDEKDTIVVPKGCMKEYQEEWAGALAYLYDYDKVLWKEN